VPTLDTISTMVHEIPVNPICSRPVQKIAMCRMCIVLFVNDIIGHAMQE